VIERDRLPCHLAILRAECPRRRCHVSISMKTKLTVQHAKPETREGPALSMAYKFRANLRSHEL